MNRKSIRVVAAANLALGCLLLQGCGIFGKKTEGEVTTIPEQEPVAVTPVEQIEPVTPVEVPSTAPLTAVQSSTPYTIQKGDTISAISYKYNLRWQDVLAVNPGITPTRLRVGQIIHLPGVVDVAKPRSVPATTPKVTAPKAAPAVAAATSTYVVKAGDSLSVVASKHGIKTAALRDANNLKGDKIVVGQKLKIPGVRKAAVVNDAKKVSPPKNDAPKAAAAAKLVKPVAAPAPAPAVAVAAEPPPPAPPSAVETGTVKAETATPPPAPPAEDLNVQTYTVKEGEDLYAVAIRWGVSPSDLKTLNNLSSNEIKAGTVLKIPKGAQ